MRKTFPVAGLLLLASALPGFGDVILTNLSQVTGGADTIASNVGLNLAGGFTMGSSSFVLTSIIWSAGTVGISSTPTSIMQASLYSGSSNPSVFELQMDFQVTSIQFSPQVTLLPHSPFTLQAGTTYWLVLQAATDSGNLGWSVSSVPASGNFASYAGARSGAGVPPTGTLESNMAFEVNGTAPPEPPPAGVPEPSAAILVSTAAAAGLLARTWRRRNN